MKHANFIEHAALTDLGPLTSGLVVFYAVHSVLGWVGPGPAAPLPVIVSNTLFAAGFVGLRLTLVKGWIHPRHASPTAAIILFLAVAQLALRLSFHSEFYLTVYIVVALLAAGFLVLSRRALMLLISGTLIVWNAVVWPLVATATAMQLATGLTVVSIVAAFIQTARLRDLRRLEKAQEAAQRQDTERAMAEAVQPVLLAISNAVWTSADLPELMQTARRELGKLIDTTNMFLAVYEAETDSYSFPYHVDKFDRPSSYSAAKLPRSFTDYVRRTGEPLLADSAVGRRLQAEGEIELVGTDSVSWMGVPLKSGDEISGVIAVQSYDQESLYSTRDLETLTFVSQTVAVAIERQRASQALRASEARYRSIVDHQTDMVVRYRPDGTRTFVNESYCRVLRQSREQLLGKKLVSWVVGEKRPVILDAIRSLTPAAPTHSAEYRVAMPQGIRWHRWTEHALFDDEGQLSEVQAVGHDVTHLKDAEEAAQKNERRLFQFLEMIPAHVLVVEAKTRTVYFVNKLAKQLSGGGGKTGVPYEDLGTASRLYVAGTDEPWPAEQLPVRRALKGQQTADDMEWHLEDRTVPIHVIASPILGPDGEVEFAIVVAFDTTELQETQERLRHSQRLAAVGQLAGGVAHDFNNLLTGITGYTELALGATGDDTSVSADLRLVLECATKAAALTRQLLAFSRLQTLEIRVLNLNTLLENATEMLGQLIGEDIEAVFIPAPDLPNIRADEGEVERVLMNLAINARDAMPGGGHLTIETGRASLDRKYCEQFTDLQPGEFVTLAVTDSGEGMDESTRLQIFDPFFTTKEVGKGTGLGLATVYGIVKQHGGHISVYSEPGQGTAFKIYFPVVGAAVDETIAVEEPAQAGAGTETILLVEDEDMVRQVTARALGDRGYRVLEAAHPDEAERLFAKNADEIDLMITDIVMPGGDGPTLCQTLRESRSDLPVLYVSGYPARGIDRMRNLGPDADFLQKPFTPEQLARHVRGILDR